MNLEQLLPYITLGSAFLMIITILLKKPGHCVVQGALLAHEPPLKILPIIKVLTC